MSGDPTPADEQSINALNRELKEPSELVFFPGCVYECTINDQRQGFNQSQFAFMLDLPSAEDVKNFADIRLWIAPPATSHITFSQNQLPTQADLEALGWRETLIGCAAYGIAVEISRQYSPWNSGQIVVLISRLETLNLTVIVGEKSFAIDKMWELVTMGNIWTRYTKHILDLITINRPGGVQVHRNMFHYAKVYPFW